MLDFNSTGLSKLASIILRGEQFDNEEEAVKSCTLILRNSSTEEYLYADATGTGLSEDDLHTVVLRLAESGVMKVDKLIAGTLRGNAYRIILNSQYICLKEARNTESAFNCVSSIAKSYCLSAHRAGFISII